jgi:hypothetical protein
VAQLLNLDCHHPQNNVRTTREQPYKKGVVCSGPCLTADQNTGSAEFNGLKCEHCDEAV